MLPCNSILYSYAHLYTHAHTETSLQAFELYNERKRTVDVTLQPVTMTHHYHTTL